MRQIKLPSAPGRDESGKTFYFDEALTPTKRYFVTGIGTDVGKTVASAILVEALEADYWKPIQSGAVTDSDRNTVQSLISNSRSVFHKEVYSLREPLSPHAAAELDNIEIKLENITFPYTHNTLIIEGAGGLMVPLNYNGLMVVDLINHCKAEAILVSRHYLGSINHTLLSIEALKSREIPIAGIIFNGAENKATERVILEQTGVRMLGRINEEPVVTKEVVLGYKMAFQTI